MAKDFPVTSGSVFWTILYLISLVGLIWIAIWSFFNNKLTGAIIAIIFFMMLVSSFVLSKETLFQSGTWKQNSTSFSLGFLMWSLVGSTSNLSVLSVTTNNLFASIASELPEFLEFLMNSFVIPIAEEALWIIALPDVLTFLFERIGTVKNFSFFKNKILQLILIAAIAAVSFAIFHVGNIAIGSFIIAAMLFRTIMIFFVVGDKKLDLIPTITIVPAFAVGAHIGHNLTNFGLGRGLSLLVQNIEIGWIVFLFFGVIFLTAADTFLGWLGKLFGGGQTKG